MAEAGRRAKQFARAWLETQPDLPIGRMLFTHAYDPHVGGRLFSVRYFARSLQQTLRLIEFYVLDGGTIRITSDQRKLAYEAGRATEDRFFSVMAVRTKDTPYWFRKIKRASWFFDKRGIDAFAFVDYIEGERRLRIPLQIKSIRSAVPHYEKKHPLCKEHGVIVIVVNPKKSDDQLRRYVYQELAAVRKRKMKDGTRFTELHSLLDQK